MGTIAAIVLASAAAAIRSARTGIAGTVNGPPRLPFRAAANGGHVDAPSLIPEPEQ